MVGQFLTDNRKTGILLPSRIRAIVFELAM
jgi:hypothetical protein